MAELYLMSISEAERVPENFCRERFPRRYEKTVKFKKREDALRSIAGGILMASMLGADEGEVAFGERGKPYLTDGKKFFSLSHSGEYALLAVGGSEIGADIEAVTVCREAAARCAFTADELEWMAADPDERFFELWTAKESLIKLDGRGLSLGMDSFSALGLVRGGTVSFGGKNVYGYTLVHDGHRIFVCAYGAFAPPALSVITAEDVLKI